MDINNNKLYASLSRKGPVRFENQDSCVLITNQYNQLLSLVCDGLGGYKGGKIASKLTAKVFSRAFQQFDFSQASNALLKKWFDATLMYARQALEDYFQSVKNNREQLAQMATTLVMSVLCQNKLYTFWIGDSRAYLIDHKHVLQLTEDHNLYNQLLKLKVSADTIASYKDQLLALTATVSKRVERELVYGFKIHEINDWEYLMLCSDGLYNFVDDDFFYGLITNAPQLRKAVFNLTKVSLENNSNDNITITLVDLQKWLQR